MSNYYCKLYTQHHSKYEESIFDRIGGEFGFKLSKNQTTDLSQFPSLLCDLTCKNLCTNETTEGLFSLHKNFIMCHEVKNYYQPTFIIFRMRAQLRCSKSLMFPFQGYKQQANFSNSK